MRKYLVNRWCLLVLLAVGGFAVISWWEPSAERISSSRHEMIEPGMSKSQVEKLVGPPGDYRTRDGPASDFDWAVGEEHWIGNEGTIVIWYDGDRVRNSVFIPSPAHFRKKTLGTKAKDWIGSLFGLAL